MRLASGTGAGNRIASDYTARMNEALADVLANYAHRLLPLTRSGTRCDPAISKLAPSELFANAKFPEAAWSGLLLLGGCWEESHNVSQDIASVEGSYWHGIAHRMEPDSFNAGYWFRRVGKHAIFPALHREAAEILEASTCGWRLKDSWDPVLFISWCDEARRQPGSEKETAALRMQKAEWDLLFRFCVS